MAELVLWPKRPVPVEFRQKEKGHRTDERLKAVIFLK